MYTNHTGFLIEFSGADGSGKSTVAQLLSIQLQKLRYKVVFEDFFVRPLYLLASKQMEDSNDHSLKSLFSVNTANILITCDELLHYYYHTLRMVENGYIVISARSLWDRIIRAIIDGASNIDDMKRLVSLSPIRPRFHFYLNIDSKESLSRIQKRGTYNESESHISSYIRLANAEAEINGWIIINANRNVDEVVNDVLKIVVTAYVK